MKTTQELQEAYLLMQDNCGIKVGDTVKVLRKADDEENGWQNSWTKDPKYMDSFIGNESEVVDIDEHGIELVCDKAHGGGWNFPFFVLEKISEAPKWYDNIPGI